MCKHTRPLGPGMRNLVNDDVHRDRVCYNKNNINIYIYIIVMLGDLGVVLLVRSPITVKINTFVPELVQVTVWLLEWLLVPLSFASGAFAIIHGQDSLLEAAHPGQDSQKGTGTAIKLVQSLQEEQVCGNIPGCIVLRRG